jgi:hypothetical protein
LVTEQNQESRGVRSEPGKQRGRTRKSETEQGEGRLRREQEEEELSLELWAPDQEGEEFFGESDQEALNEDEEGPDAEEREEEWHDGAELFPSSKRSGDPYFNPIHVCLLRMLGDNSISGTQYLIPFKKYHHQTGGYITRNIVEHVISNPFR